MSYSRRQLYAMGECLGESVTRKEAGRVIYGGGGGKSSSKSSATTTTTNIDKRQVVDAGAVGVTADNSSINVTATTSDPATIKSAMDAIVANDATTGASFTALLGLADKLFTAGSQTLQTQSAATMSQVGALTTIANDQKGAIDQKTLVILAVAGVGIVALRGKK